MKRVAFHLALALSFVSIAQVPVNAQKNKRVDNNTYYRAPGNAGGKTIIIPIGTTFEGRISDTVSSARSNPGQAFEIRMSSPVLANGSDVVIPAGSSIIGEVVEAVPSSRFPRKKRMPIPRGKLRVQINGLRTPDGVQYPLVASLAGEEGGRSNRNSIGAGIAYMGSASSFEAVAPGMNKLGRNNNRRGPEITSKREAMRHEIYGMDQNAMREDDATIRSLVVRKHDYWIDAGSPLTVRLGAPLKLAVTKPGEGVSLGSVEDAPTDELPAPSLRRQSAPPERSAPVSSATPQPPPTAGQPPLSTDF